MRTKVWPSRLTVLACVALSGLVIATEFRHAGDWEVVETASYEQPMVVELSDYAYCPQLRLVVVDRSGSGREGTHFIGIGSNPAEFCERHRCSSWTNRSMSKGEKVSRKLLGPGGEPVTLEVRSGHPDVEVFLECSP